MENHRLIGKIAVVSGSSMGIGKAIALDLAEEGATLILNGRKLVATEKEFRDKGFTATAIMADIRFPIQCQKLISETISEYGRLDILVNNAAISSRRSVERMAHYLIWYNREKIKKQYTLIGRNSTDTAPIYVTNKD